MVTVLSQAAPRYGQDPASPASLGPAAIRVPAVPLHRPASRRDACIRVLGMLLLVAVAAQVPEDGARWPGPLGSGPIAAVRPPAVSQPTAAEPAAPVADVPEDVSRALRDPVADVPEDVSRAL